eukprot:746229-Hanusia_phi.AAC.10
MKKLQDLEAKGQADRAASLKTTVRPCVGRRQSMLTIGQIDQGKQQLQSQRDEVMRVFMNVEQKKPLLQSAVQTFLQVRGPSLFPFSLFLQAQLQFHEDCLKSTEEALVQCKG